VTQTEIDMDAGPGLVDRSSKEGDVDLEVDLDAGFIDLVPMEADPSQLFPGDSGTLPDEVRRVLVQVLRRRCVWADADRAQWKVLLDNQQVVESRLHDMFVRLVVDHERGVAYKRQVRFAEAEAPVLLRDEPYTRAETLVLVHLRTIYQREQGAGEVSARVDIEEIEATVLSYFDPDDTNVAARQKEIASAVKRLTTDGILDEESDGRYRVTPLVEVVLSVERLTELRQRLREGTVSDPDPADTDEDIDLSKNETCLSEDERSAGRSESVDSDPDDETIATDEVPA